MRMLLTMLPTLTLVVFSQLAIKWRVQTLQHSSTADMTSRLVNYLSDAWIWAAYAAAFLGGVFWMFVVERFAISVAFPVYIGATVVCVLIGSALCFGEALRPVHLLAVVLIVAGVMLAVQS